MNYPTLPNQSVEREVINTFRGYNHNMRIGKGEFYDMRNLTSSYFPLITPRAQRGFYTGGGNITTMIAKDKLCYTDGRYVVIGQDRIDMGLTQGDKSLVSMGAYIVILPDKKYINTVDYDDKGQIEADMKTTGSVSFVLCQLSGEPFDITYVGDKEPSDIENTKYWMDTSTKPNTLKKYSTASGMWVAITSTYIKISSMGIGIPFEEGDGVTISGLKDAQLIDSSSGSVITDPDINAIDGSFVILKKDDDSIIITGMIGEARSIRNQVTVQRSMPEMDFCIESGNRLWGCKYGLDKEGKTLNEIYASKLGDFKNWNCFQGVSTDSYIASCGTDGPFTGAITHLGYPLFFKEEYLHKVYGNFPANFRIQTTACRGVQKGSWKSVAIVGETLYYKSRLGVCAYDGSLPGEISTAMGDISYSNAVGGAHGNKYYISMMDNDGIYHLFVFDASKNMWHKEDNTHVKEFCSFGNDIYFLDAADGQIKTMLGSISLDRKPVSWMAETGLFGVDDPGKKYISRVEIRIQLEPESAVNVYIDYDSENQWRQVCAMKGTTLRSFDIPIRPKRCDHFRLRMEGEGPAKIFSICKSITRGSGY